MMHFYAMYDFFGPDVYCTSSLDYIEFFDLWSYLLPKKEYHIYVRQGTLRSANVLWFDGFTEYDVKECL